MSTFDKLKAHLDEGVVGFPTALASSVGVILASPVILTVTTGFGLGGGIFASAMTIASSAAPAGATAINSSCAICTTRANARPTRAPAAARLACITTARGSSAD